MATEGGTDAEASVEQAVSTSARRGSNRLHLGCGHDYRDGWINVDIDPSVDPDIIHDLEDTPWPFDNGQFDRIEAHHVLEHVDDLDSVLSEIARVLRPHCLFVLTFPIGHTRFEDATHEQVWNYYTAEWIAGERKHSHEAADDFDLLTTDVEWQLAPPDPWLALKTKYKLLRHGPGGWLDQVTGLYGEVTARYEREGDG